MSKRMFVLIGLLIGVLSSVLVSVAFPQISFRDFMLVYAALGVTVLLIFGILER